MSLKLKRVIWISTAVFVFLLMGYAALLNRSGPGPADQEIQGIAIGQYQAETGIAMISGKRLDCQMTPNDVEFNSTCSIEVQGETLTILAAWNTPQDRNMFDGQCAAFYGDETLTCSYGSPHVHVHGFAYVSMPSALELTDMNQLRRQYWFENRPESFYVSSIFVIGFLAALLAVANLFTLLWNRSRSRWVLSIVGAIPTGFIAFYAGMLVAFSMMGNFFD